MPLSKTDNDLNAAHVRKNQGRSVSRAQQFATDTDAVANCKKESRIERFLANPDFIMQMRAINTPGAAHPPDHRSDAHIRALAHRDF